MINLTFSKSLQAGAGYHRYAAHMSTFNASPMGPGAGMLDAGCQFFGLRSRAIDAARRHICWNPLMQFGRANISSLVAINEVAYHQRMDILSSMGMMVLLSFVSWHLLLLLDLMSMVRSNNENILLSLLRQGGFDHMAQSGLLCPVDPGYSCILSLFTDCHICWGVFACVYIILTCLRFLILGLEDPRTVHIGGLLDGCLYTILD